MFRRPRAIAGSADSIELSSAQRRTASPPKASGQRILSHEWTIPKGIKMNLTYTIDDSNQEFEYYYDGGLTPEGNVEKVFMLQECAEDYHCNHDGWEASWPLTIKVSIGGKPYCKGDVERESEPVFYATVAKETEH